jgi:hypothetical protein
MIPIPSWVSPLVNGLLLLLALALVVSFWLAFGEWVLIALFVFALAAFTLAVIFKGEPTCICPPDDVLEHCPKCGGDR